MTFEGNPRNYEDIWYSVWAVLAWTWVLRIHCRASVTAQDATWAFKSRVSLAEAYKQINIADPSFCSEEADEEVVIERPQDRTLSTSATIVAAPPPPQPVATATEGSQDMMHTEQDINAAEDAEDVQWDRPLRTDHHKKDTGIAPNGENISARSAASGRRNRTEPDKDTRQRIPDTSIVAHFTPQITLETVRNFLERRRFPESYTDLRSSSDDRSTTSEDSSSLPGSLEALSPLTSLSSDSSSQSDVLDVPESDRLSRRSLTPLTPLSSTSSGASQENAHLSQASMVSTQHEHGDEHSPQPPQPLGQRSSATTPSRQGGSDDPPPSPKPSVVNIPQEDRHQSSVGLAWAKAVADWPAAQPNQYNPPANATALLRELKLLHTIVVFKLVLFEHKAFPSRSHRVAEGILGATAGGQGRCTGPGTYFPQQHPLSWASKQDFAGRKRWRLLVAHYHATFCPHGWLNGYPHTGLVTACILRLAGKRRS